MIRSQGFLQYFFIFFTNFTESWTSNTIFMSQLDFEVNGWTPSCRYFQTLMILQSLMEVRFNQRLLTIGQEQQEHHKKEKHYLRSYKCSHEEQIPVGAGIKYEVKHLQQEAGKKRGTRDNFIYHNSYIFTIDFLICFDFNTDYGTEPREIFH